MKEFVLLFRMDITTKAAQPTKSQMDIYIQQWMEWINYLSEAGRLLDGGNHFSKQGRVLKPESRVEDNPYIADNVSVAGYLIIKAIDLTEAAKFAAECPILKGKGSSVEIREVATPG